MQTRKFEPNNESDRDYVDRIVRVARTLFDYQAQRGLAGACHELSAICFILLRESGITEAQLCIGVVYSPYAPPFVPSNGIEFDHSWIEVGGAPVDVACAAPLPHVGVPIAPVIVGMHIDDGRPSELAYGVPGTLDADAARVADQTIAEYFAEFVRSGEPNPWETTVSLGQRLGLTLDEQVLRKRYGTTRRTARC